MAFLEPYRLLMSNTFGRIASIPLPVVLRELTQDLMRAALADCATTAAKAICPAANKKP
jgi:hypothetical protein